MAEETLAETPTTQVAIIGPVPEDEADVVFTLVKRPPVAIDLDLQALTWDDFVLIQQAAEMEDQVAGTKQIIEVIGKVTTTDLTKVGMQVLMKIIKRVMDSFKQVGNPKN